jgi:CheY-like chemotaxis protein
VSIKKVLIVDDNSVNLQILEEMLSGDYRLKFARNGREAVAVASTFQPAIVLLDVMLPDVDGLTVCRRLRRLPGVSGAVIIMVSAKAMPSEEEDGLRAGADEYITKPFDETQLVELLRTYANTVAEGSTDSSGNLSENRGLTAF